MAISKAYLDYLTDTLRPLGHVTARKMFGGASLYCDGVIFALVDDDVLYLKADDTTKARFETEGLKPFTYEGQTGPVSMSYWRAPERLLDDTDELLEWAREAVNVARKVPPKKAAKKVGDQKPGEKKARKSAPRAPVTKSKSRSSKD